eukprot:gnl/MRDRNA2_/MRDRNA2_83833_c0_seq1.p1 gnl/MRDRNA2_/MRDRNA2_83833_c0~~gnl/MRDRNA2_/MRDRNA2_83833_c0_seq1.p1  ORF type:complete len:309 (+),score=41.43 gnl/MRDRNA2_/MRDRNA2_83833_c0_seq1:82-1008(+)
MMNNPLFTLCVFSLFINASCLRLVPNHLNGLEEPSQDKITMNWNATSDWEQFIKHKSPVKLLFFAGIEGSGHHLLEAVVEQVNKLWKKAPQMADFGNSSWQCGAEWGREGIGEVVRAWKSLKPGLHILPQAFSYPMCGVSDGFLSANHDERAHKFYPHIDWMKEAADKAGVKLHILYLYRHVPDCLAADCLHRRFENCSDQAETLFYNGAELMKQLQKIPKSDYSCFHYGDVNNMKSAIEESFGVNSGRLIDVTYAEHPPKSLREHEERWSNFESQLERTNLEMSLACSAANSIAFSGILNYVASTKV